MRFSVAIGLSILATVAAGPFVSLKFVLATSETPESTSQDLVVFVASNYPEFYRKMFMPYYTSLCENDLEKCYGEPTPFISISNRSSKKAAALILEAGEHYWVSNLEPGSSYGGPLPNNSVTIRVITSDMEQDVISNQDLDNTKFYDLTITDTGPVWTIREDA